MKVVFLDAATLPQALQFASPEIEYVSYDATSSDQVAARIAGAAVVITNKVRLTAQHFADTPTLRLVAVAAAGTDLSLIHI